MLRRWMLAAAVLAAWGSAMAWRVRRDLLPALREASKPSYRLLLQGRLPLRESFRVGVRGREIGRLLREARRLDDGSVLLGETLQVSGAALLESVPILRMTGWDPGEEPVRVQSSTFLTPEYRLSGFDLKGRLGPIPVKASGEMRPEGMHVLLDLGGTVQKALVPADPDRPLLTGVSGLGALPGLAPGRTWESSFLNPLTGRTETLKAEVVGEEDLELGGGRVRARRVRVRHGMGEATLWLDRKGRLLRQELMGLTLEREASGD